jgi:hypothetical protein
MKNIIIYAALLPFCLTISSTTAGDPGGRWKGTDNSPNGSMDLMYTFKIDGQKLSGSVEGPNAALDLENGSYKDSVLSFDLVIMGKPLHQTGKYYGDSVVLDFTVRSGPKHLKLLKAE